MTDSRFDPASSTLRLSDRGRVALTQFWREDEGVSAESRAELESGGLLAGEKLHPTIARVAQCLAEPAVRLEFELVQPKAVRFEGWMGDGLAVLLAREHPGTSAANVVAVPWSMVPMSLARAVDLGPRPAQKVREPVAIDAGLLEALLSVGPSFEPSQVEGLLDPDAQFLPAWVEVLAGLSEGTRRWRAGVWWNSADEHPTARSLEVLDGKAGMFLVTQLPRARRRMRRIELRPLRSGEVWLLLSGLLPRRHEATRPLDA